MKRRHKVAAGSGAVILALVGLATVALEIYRDHEQADRADRNQAAWECAVKLCEAQGGHWKGTSCIGRRR